MRFNSQELGVRLGGKEDEGKPDREHQTHECDCGCTNGCTSPTRVLTVPEPDPPGPEKPPGGEGYRLAGLEMLRAQMRESLGSAAR